MLQSPAADNFCSCQILTETFRMNRDEVMQRVRTGICWHLSFHLNLGIYDLQ